MKIINLLPHTILIHRHHQGPLSVAPHYAVRDDLPEQEIGAYAVHVCTAPAPVLAADLSISQRVRDVLPDDRVPAPAHTFGVPDPAPDTAYVVTATAAIGAFAAGRSVDDLFVAEPIVGTRTATLTPVVGLLTAVLERAAALHRRGPAQADARAAADAMIAFMPALERHRASLESGVLDRKWHRVVRAVEHAIEVELESDRDRLSKEEP